MVSLNRLKQNKQERNENFVFFPIQHFVSEMAKNLKLYIKQHFGSLFNEFNEFCTFLLPFFARVTEFEFSGEHEKWTFV